MAPNGAYWIDASITLIFRQFNARAFIDTSSLLADSVNSTTTRFFLFGCSKWIRVFHALLNELWECLAHFMPTKKLFGAKSYLLLLEQTFIVGASLCVTESLLPVYEKKHLVKKSNISGSHKAVRYVTRLTSIRGWLELGIFALCSIVK